LLDKVTRERLAQANGRLKAGNVGVLIRHRGLKLYLRAMLPPKPGSPKDKPHQQEIATGFRANPAGISAAEKEARRVGSLLEGKEFSWLPYIKKYQLPELPADIDEPPQISTLELWDKYVVYKTPSVAETTIRSTYTKTRKKVVKFGRTISDRLTAIEFRDFLLQDGCKPVTARKYLVQLNACHEWGMECALVDQNPFSGLAKQLVVRNESKGGDPFSQEEVKEILEAFQTHKYYSYYYPYVKFLFLTGCRPEDAVGLQWKHIDWKAGVINFEEAVETSFKVRKDPKNHKARVFPINSQVREVLQSVKPGKPLPEDPVFRSKEGCQLNHPNFIRRAWHGYTNRHKRFVPGIVMKLAEEGKIDHYREPYACRDTFISHCVEKRGLGYKQVSEWVGNSSAVVHKHYAGTVDRVEVPDLGF
jgi:integrase